MEITSDDAMDEEECIAVDSPGMKSFHTTGKMEQTFDETVAVTMGSAGMKALKLTAADPAPQLEPEKHSTDPNDAPTSGCDNGDAMLSLPSSSLVRMHREIESSDMEEEDDEPTVKKMKTEKVENVNESKHKVMADETEQQGKQNMEGIKPDPSQNPEETLTCQGVCHCAEILKGLQHNKDLVLELKNEVTKIKRSFERILQRGVRYRVSDVTVATSSQPFVYPSEPLPTSSDQIPPVLIPTIQSPSQLASTEPSSLDPDPVQAKARTETSIVLPNPVQPAGKIFESLPTEKSLPLKLQTVSSPGMASNVQPEKCTTACFIRDGQFSPAQTSCRAAEPLKAASSILSQLYPPQSRSSVLSQSFPCASDQLSYTFESRQTVASTQDNKGTDHIQPVTLLPSVLTTPTRSSLYAPRTSELSHSGGLMLYPSATPAQLLLQSNKPMPLDFTKPQLNQTLNQVHGSQVVSSSSVFIPLGSMQGSEHKLTIMPPASQFSKGLEQLLGPKPVIAPTGQSTKERTHSLQSGGMKQGYEADNTSNRQCSKGRNELLGTEQMQEPDRNTSNATYIHPAIQPSKEYAPFPKPPVTNCKPMQGLNLKTTAASNSQYSMGTEQALLSNNRGLESRTANISQPGKGFEPFLQPLGTLSMLENKIKAMSAPYSQCSKSFSKQRFEPKTEETCTSNSSTEFDRFQKMFDTGPKAATSEQHSKDVASLCTTPRQRSELQTLTNVPNSQCSSGIDVCRRLAIMQESIPKTRDTPFSQCSLTENTYLNRCDQAKQVVESNKLHEDQPQPDNKCWQQPPEKKQAQTLLQDRETATSSFPPVSWPNPMSFGANGLPEVDVKTPAFEINSPWPILKARAFSRPNFAWKVTEYIFSAEELKGRNCKGMCQKKALDIEKLSRVKQIVFIYWPRSSTEKCESTLWRDCEKTIDSSLRSRVKYKAVNAAY